MSEKPTFIIGFLLFWGILIYEAEIETIHERLKEARKNLKLSQEFVARQMHLSRPTISVIESGQRKISAEELAGFSELYGISADDLNKKLFQYAPFPEEAEKTRTDNNLMPGAKFETADWSEVAMELVKLQAPVEDLMRDANKLTLSEYVL